MPTRNAEGYIRRQVKSNFKTSKKKKTSTRFLLRVALTLVAYVLLTDPWPLNRKEYE